MKIMIRAARFTIGERRFAVAMFCGERWYSPVSWRRYTLFGRLKSTPGFHIGPIMFWNGS